MSANMIISITFYCNDSSLTFCNILLVHLQIGLIGLVELDWLKILSTVSPDDVLYTDYVECAKMLVPQLTDEVNMQSILYILQLICVNV